MQDNNDDEVVIDFKKIANFFKRKKKLGSFEREVKHTEADIKSQIKEETQRLDKLKKDEAEIEKAEKTLEKDERLAQTIDKEKKELQKDLRQIRDKVSEAKEDLDEEEIQFDLQKIRQIFKQGDVGKFLNKYGIFLVILIPVILGIFFRMYPSHLPLTDEWAQSTVYNSYKSQISAQIDAQYPNLPAQNKQTLIDNEFANLLESQKAQIQGQIEATSDYFKSRFKNEDGQTYLLAIDPYLWYGEARNYVNYGHLGDKLINGTSYYSLRNGRIDKEVSKQLHPIIIANLYSFVHFFNRNFTLLRSAFLLPVILITLSVIPAFFIARRFGGVVGGLFAAIMVAINSSLLGRTPAGFADTDGYNVMMPLFIVWIFLEAFETKDLKKKIILTSLSGFLTGVFSFLWGPGWAYVFNFVLATIGIYLIYVFISNYKDVRQGFANFVNKLQVRNTLIIALTYLATTGIFVTWFKGSLNFYISGFVRLFSFIRLKEVAVRTLWPNVLTTVAEFNPPQLSSIVSHMGGNVLFWISLVGISLLLFNRKKLNFANIAYLVGSTLYYLVVIYMKESLNDPVTFIIIIALPIIAGLLKIFYLKEGDDIDIKLALLLMIWFMGTAYSFTKGVRFAILMVPAFAIAFGITIGTVFQYLSKIITKEMNINSFFSKAFVIIMVSLLLINPLKAAHSTARQEMPSMTDTWYESLTAIKDSSEDAIITSWWDFGHWFVAIAERRVTFDGGDQGRRIHWVGKSILANDEKVNVGILRMLNCGQEEAFDVLDSYLNDTVVSINLLNEIILMEREDASKRLEAVISPEQAKNVLELTHCPDLIDQYYITSQDMIGKAGVWAHFGSWDFERASMWQSVIGKNYDSGTDILENRFNLTPDLADRYYYEIQETKADQWIAPWPSFRSDLNRCTHEGDLLSCANGPIVNLTNYDVTFPTPEGDMHPASVVYPGKTDLLEKKFSENTAPVSVVLIGQGDDTRALLVDPPLAKSMFIRLFFFDGLGSRHYTIVSDKTTVTGQKVQVWKVEWEEQEPITLSGKTVKLGDTISLAYIGWIDNGTVFDSTIVDWQEKQITEDTPLTDTEEFEFTVGSGQVIGGFDDAVLGMKINETKTFRIPPEEAYGTDPAAHPLGNKTLNFKIRLLKIS